MKNIWLPGNGDSPNGGTWSNSTNASTNNNSTESSGDTHELFEMMKAIQEELDEQRKDLPDVYVFRRSEYEQLLKHMTTVPDDTEPEDLLITRFLGVTIHIAETEYEYWKLCSDLAFKHGKRVGIVESESEVGE